MEKSGAEDPVEAMWLYIERLAKSSSDLIAFVLPKYCSTTETMIKAIAHTALQAIFLYQFNFF